MNCAMRRSGNWTPVNIASMIVGFVLFWPVGLVILFYILNGGDMGRQFERASTWLRETCRGNRAGDGQTSGTTGNSAFEEYKAETLKRLQEEETAFKEFMERLRRARDKEEFDRFMAERNAA